MSLKYRLFALSLILVFLILPGCAQDKEDGENEKGVKGVEIKAEVTNNNLYTTDSDINFQIQLNIINNGYYDVKASDILLTYSGYDKGLAELYEAPQTFSKSNDEVLFGVTPLNPKGSAYPVFVEGNIHLPWASHEADFEYDMNLFIKYCYKYKTKLSTVVCIDPNQGYNSNSACKMKKLYPSGGQGAPIEFTEILPIVTSNKLAFQIYLKNSGNGLAFPVKGIFGSSYLQNCENLEMKSENYGQLTVKATLGEKIVECSPSPVMVDYEGSYVVCNFGKPDSQSAYSTALNLETEYTYVDTADAPVHVTFLKQ